MNSQTETLKFLSEISMAFRKEIIRWSTGIGAFGVCGECFIAIHSVLYYSMLGLAEGRGKTRFGAMLDSFRLGSIRCDFRDIERVLFRKSTALTFLTPILAFARKSHPVRRPETRYFIVIDCVLYYSMLGLAVC